MYCILIINVCIKGLRHEIHVVWLFDMWGYIHVCTRAVAGYFYLASPILNNYSHIFTVISKHCLSTLQRKSHLCIPFLEIARPQPQCVSSQTHECGN
jgi:hypothetical protein